MPNNAAHPDRTRRDAWLAVLVELPSSELRFDVIRTTGPIGAVWTTADRNYTAVPADRFGYDIVLRDHGTVRWAETLTEARSAIFHDQRDRAEAAFDAAYGN